MSIDNILNAGDDQISSQYQMIWPNGIPGGGNADLLAIRQQGEFAPPDRGPGTYDVWYQGQKVTKTNVVEETDKTFTIEYRLDANWDVFNALNEWYKLVYDEINGAASSDPDTRTTLEIEYLNGADKQVTHTERFLGVKLTNLGHSAASHESGDPIVVTATFLYLSREDF